MDFCNWAASHCHVGFFLARNTSLHIFLTWIVICLNFLFFYFKEPPVTFLLPLILKYSSLTYVVCCLFVYWRACVKAHNPFTKLLDTKYFCTVCFLGPCTAWNPQSRFDASLRLGTPVVERWSCLPMPSYLDADPFLGFCFSPRVLGHHQITCWTKPTTELIFRKFLLLALSFPNFRLMSFLTFLFKKMGFPLD